MLEECLAQHTALGALDRFGVDGLGEYKGGLAR